VKAEADLKKIGRVARRPLEEALADDASSPEMRKRAGRLLGAIGKLALPPERMHEEATRLRALQVLEWLAAPEALAHLRALAEGDPDAPLTRYAQAILALRPPR
jgi:hypothetical protein